jgi:hypothetical protein
VGFEPTVPLRVRTPSKRVPSTTRSSLPAPWMARGRRRHGCHRRRLEAPDGPEASAYTDVRADAREKTRAPQGAPLRKTARGESGIRTHGALTGSTVFETVRFDRSRISPRVVRPPRPASGRPLRAQEDSNLRPLDPQSNALSRLSYGHTRRRGRDSNPRYLLPSTTP